jgi:hypothetical protein
MRNSKMGGLMNAPGQLMEDAPDADVRLHTPHECGAHRSYPTARQVYERAMSIWMANGCPIGQAQRHWHDAEAELLNELNTASPRIG